MGFRAVGRAAEGYNTVNEQVMGGAAETGAPEAGNFLVDWVTNKLPDMVTDLAVRVVDDGSGTIAKEVLDAGQDQSFIGTLFR